MSCSQVRRELEEHLAFREELGPRSGPHLVHLESCPDCREEMGIDRQLVKSLRRALQARVEGGALSQTSWELVRLRTVDRPEPRWTVHALHWRGMASAVAAGVLMFSVATGSATLPLPVTGSPAFNASFERRAAPPGEKVGNISPISPDRAEADPPPKGGRAELLTADDGATTYDEPPIRGRVP